METNDTSMNDLSTQVVDKIRERGLAPAPKWHFLVRRSVFWTCALASVVFGSVSLAVAHFVFFDNEGASAATLLESPLETVIQVVPVVWLVGLVAFVVSAYLSLRKTRTGYRYRTAGAILGVVACTVAFGTVLILLDFGQAVHDYLLTNTTFYDALVHSSDDEIPAPL